MLPITCEICEQPFNASRDSVSCPDHHELSFHLRCYLQRESSSGFGCPKCEAEEKESEE